MRKALKKALTLALACVMCLGMGTMAMAAESTSGTDAGTITINGLESGVTVSAYQIVDAVYDESGNFVGYKLLYSYDGSVFGNTEDTFYGWSEDEMNGFTESDYASLFSAVTGNAYKTAQAGENGTATFKDMEIGSYLFVVTGSEGTVYGMVVGSVYYGSGNDGWTTEEGEVSVTGEGNLWVKSSAPSITKEETGGSLDDYEHGGSADVGDELTYHITVANIPTYEGQYPVFNVTDEIADELTITAEELEALTVTIGGTTLVKGTDYTVTDYTASPMADGKYGFVIDFVVNGSYTLNDYAGQTLVIEFGATVTAETDADLAADDVDHENDAILDYATTSYVYQSDVNKQDADHDYTFNAKIQKVDQDSNALAGATFALYTDENCETAYTQNGTAITATSGSDGYFEFAGLEEGTYYMKETKAPAGYAVSTNTYKIVITVSYNADGTLAEGYSIMVYDHTNGDAQVGNAIVRTTSATISNTKVGMLPSMGGKGTLTITLIGCAVVACAVAGTAVSRRRRAA